MPGMAVQAPVGRRLRRALGPVAAMLLATLAIAASARADDLRIDDSYAGDGVAKIRLGGARSVDVTTDEATGRSWVLLSVAGDGVAVVELDGSGHQVDSFGIQAASIPSLDAAVTPVAIARQADGALVVVAQKRGTSSAVVFRLTPAGKLDPSYGVGGIRQFSLNPSTEEGWEYSPPASGPTALTIDSSGRAVVAGNAVAPGNSQYQQGGIDAWAARLTTTGDLDPGFSGDGRASAGMSIQYSRFPTSRMSGDFVNTVVVLDDGSVCTDGYIIVYDDFAPVPPPRPGEFCWYSTGDPLRVGFLEQDSGETVAAIRAPDDGIYRVDSRYDSVNSPPFTYGHFNRGGDISLVDPATAPGAHFNPTDVDVLGGDAIVAGAGNAEPNAPLGPALFVMPAAGGAPVDALPLDLGAGTAVAVAADSADGAVVALDLDDDADGVASVARVTTAAPDEPEGPGGPGPDDPGGDPPDEDPGHLSLGRLSSPRTFARLVRRGADIEVACSRECSVRLDLVASRRAVKRFDLPGRRLTGYSESLVGGTLYTAHLPIHGATSARLLRTPEAATRRLHLRVAASVTYAG